MPITVNESGVLHELTEVTVNEGGTLYNLDTVHANEGGVLQEIFSAKTFPKALIWYVNTSSYGSVKNSGLECTATYTGGALYLVLYFKSTKVGELIHLLGGDEVTFEILSTTSNISYGRFYLKRSSQEYDASASYVDKSEKTSLSAGDKLTVTAPTEGDYNLVISLSTTGTVKFKISFR